MYINWDEVELTMGHSSTETTNKFINLKSKDFNPEINLLFLLSTSSCLRASEIDSLKYIN